MTTRTWLALTLLGLLACSSLVDAGKYHVEENKEGYGGHGKKHGGDDDKYEHKKVKVVVEKPKKYYTTVKKVVTYSVKDWKKCEKVIPQAHYLKYDKYEPEKKYSILYLIKIKKCEAKGYAPCCSYDGYEYYNECYATCFDVKYTIGACPKKPVVTIVEEPEVKKHFVKKHKIHYYEPEVEYKPRYDHKKKYEDDYDHKKKYEDNYDHKKYEVPKVKDYGMRSVENEKQ